MAEIINAAKTMTRKEYILWKEMFDLDDRIKEYRQILGNYDPDGGETMKEKLNVGLIVTLSGRWPRELPEKRLGEYTAWARENLEAEMNLTMPERVLTTPEEVHEAIRMMRANLVDVVIMVYGAFTGDDIAAAIV